MMKVTQIVAYLGVDVKSSTHLLVNCDINQSGTATDTDLMECTF